MVCFFRSIFAQSHRCTLDEIARLLNSPLRTTTQATPKSHTEASLHPILQSQPLPCPAPHRPPYPIPLPSQDRLEPITCTILFHPCFIPRSSPPSCRVGYSALIGTFSYCSERPALDNVMFGTICTFKRSSIHPLAIKMLIIHCLSNLSFVPFP